MKRRYPALVVVGAAFAALIVGARTRVEPETPTFSVSASGWMPSAPPVSGLTETWFCPGVPASGVEGVEGAIRIANRVGERLVGQAVETSAQLKICRAGRRLTFQTASGA